MYGFASTDRTAKSASLSSVASAVAASSSRTTRSLAFIFPVESKSLPVARRPPSRETRDASNATPCPSWSAENSPLTPQ